MIKIGITGGIGSGKSTVCRAFAQLGVPVYDSDSRARRLMNEDVALKAAVSGLFGDGAYDADGLNRKYVAGRIFSDGTIRRTCLRDGVAPEAVRARMAAQIDEAERIARADYVIRSGDEEPVLPKILELHGIFCRLR